MVWSAKCARSVIHLLPRAADAPMEALQMVSVAAAMLVTMEMVSIALNARRANTQMISVSYFNYDKWFWSISQFQVSKISCSTIYFLFLMMLSWYFVCTGMGQCRDCKVCHSEAFRNGLCSTTEDTLVCGCNLGFVGNGISCSVCPKGFYSPVLGACVLYIL